MIHFRFAKLALYILAICALYIKNDHGLKLRKVDKAKYTKGIIICSVMLEVLLLKKNPRHIGLWNNKEKPPAPK